MQIIEAKDTSRTPRTRRELLAHLWAIGVQCNIFKEGAFYAVTGAGMISATGIRRIDSLTFEQWTKRCRDVMDGWPF